jgi:mannose-6-phosphate isomerase
MKTPGKDSLAPLLFEPVYMDKIWGGGMLSSVLGRETPALPLPVGEAWEISDRDEAQSVVSSGPLKGQTLRSLLKTYGKNLAGKKYDGGKFPLLVKIIDAGERLSLQVHPNEAACAALGGGAEPKTEMWYIIAAEKGAKIIAGLKSSATKRQFLDTISSTEVEDCLQIFDSIPGDAYFINAGRIHAIGAGNLLLEIQQSSDTTYRVSDWGRTGPDGKPRELHVDKALKSIDFMDRTVQRISGVSNEADHNRKYPVINKCPFFQVSDIRIVEEWRDTTYESGSFHIITPINNPVVVGRGDLSIEVPRSRSCLVPACMGPYSVKPSASGETVIIRTNI